MIEMNRAEEHRELVLSILWHALETKQNKQSEEDEVETGGSVVEARPTRNQAPLGELENSDLLCR